MDIVDVKQLESLIYSLSLGAAIIIALIFYIAWKHEMRTITTERLRDKNSVKAVLIEICTEQFKKGKFQSTDDCLSWLQCKSSAYKNNGHAVLGPLDYYQISVTAKQRARKR